MIAKLTALFTVVTVVELCLLIPIGGAIGVPWTIALVLGTALLGGTLAKRQGTAIWKRLQKELRSGQLPGDTILDGLAVLVAGAFLMTPGVLTDVAGIGLLIPVVRKPLKALVKSRFEGMLESSTVSYFQASSADGSSLGGASFDRSSFDRSSVDDSSDDRSASFEYENIDRSPSQQRSSGDDVIDVTPIDSDNSADDNDETAAELATNN